MVGLKKNDQKNRAKFCHQMPFALVLQTIGNFWAILHIIYLQFSAVQVEPRSHVSMTGMQLTRQEAQTSQPQLSAELHITCKNTLFTIHELQFKNVPLNLLKNPSGYLQKEINQVLMFNGCPYRPNFFVCLNFLSVCTNQ